ncbi:MAG TPA: GNAT family N-acetyltransferase [Chitinophagaceae bacterium]
MIIREALITDIPGMQRVRNAVKENMLSNPSLVSDDDCRSFITERGKGWVCEIEGAIAGFSIADLREQNIWALFVDPRFEKKGIGSRLHDIMLEWYFSQLDTAWLGTAPGTRAEQFYHAKGWIATGMHGKGEIKFEMTRQKWQEKRGCK